MSGWLLASYIVLWALVVGLTVVLLVVLRQLGLIYLRTRSGLNLDEGPAVGAAITAFDEIDDRSGSRFRVPDQGAELTMIVFASPHCAICEDVLRGLPHATRARGVAAVVISEGTHEENAELRRTVDGQARFVTSIARQRHFGVETIPYALVTSAEGVVLAKHVVNGLDDLEDLVDRAGQPVGAGSPFFPSVYKETQHGTGGQ